MKLSTPLWAKFESPGYPKLTEVHQGSIRELTHHLIKWLTSVKMGSQLRIMMTRSEAELSQGRGALISDDILGEFAHLLEEEGTD